MVIQFPGSVSDEEVRGVPADAFVALAHRAIHAGILLADPAVPGRSARMWLQAILTAAPEGVADLVREMSVAPLKGRLDPGTGSPDPAYVAALVARVHELALIRLVAEGTSELRRVQDDPVRAHEVSARVAAYQRRLHTLRAGMA